MFYIFKITLDVKAMKFLFTHTDFPNNTFEVESALFTTKHSVFMDGRPLKRLLNEKDKPFVIPQNTKEDKLVYVKSTFPPDVAPTIIIDGKVVSYVPKLYWWQDALVYSPFILAITSGFIGGLLGGTAIATNLILIRSDYSVCLKHLLIVIVIAMACGTTILLSWFLTVKIL